MHEKRVLVAMMLVAPAACFSSPQFGHRRRVQPRTTIRMFNDKELNDEKDVWKFREDFVRGSFENVVNWKEDAREAQERRAKRREEDGGAAAKNAFAASATAVIVGALVLRLGGRAVLVSVLGLDMVAELGIGDQIDQVLAYSQDAGAWTVVAFLAAWIVAKVFLVDVIALALAFSSGVLFGGVLEGAVISAVGATIGSLTALTLSRTLLQDRVEGAISKRPVARGLAKVVEDDGFKTVLVLRLSPICAQPPTPLRATPHAPRTRARPHAVPHAHFNRRGARMPATHPLSLSLSLSLSSSHPLILSSSHPLVLSLCAQCPFRRARTPTSAPSPATGPS